MSPKTKLFALGLLIVTILTGCVPSFPKWLDELNITPDTTHPDSSSEMTSTDTPTSDCTLKCNIDTESYGFSITCESGQVTKTTNDAISFEYTDGQRSKIMVAVDQELAYETTQNTYKITGNIEVDESANKVTYDIIASGGAFGETPQTCKQD